MPYSTLITLSPTLTIFSLTWPLIFCFAFISAASSLARSEGDIFFCHTPRSNWLTSELVMNAFGSAIGRLAEGRRSRPVLVVEL
ncbi:hypothetical protein CLU79DRAFT_765568 [Phycomyces nitens]|nr:hypothetical protein CLU79DRAFT_765568 [Phycomyces nitens]